MGICYVTPGVQPSAEDLEGWDGVGDGRENHKGHIRYTCG